MNIASPSFLTVLLFFAKDTYIRNWQRGLHVLMIGILSLLINAITTSLIFVTIKRFENVDTLKVPFASEALHLPTSEALLAILVFVFLVAAVLKFYSVRLIIDYSIKYFEDMINRCYAILGRQQHNPNLIKYLSHVDLRGLLVMDTRYSSLAMQEYLTLFLPLFTFVVSVCVLIYLQPFVVLCLGGIFLLGAPAYLSVAKQGRQATQDIITTSPKYVVSNLKFIETQYSNSAFGQNEAAHGRAINSVQAERDESTFDFLDAYKRRRLITTRSDLISNALLAAVIGFLVIYFGDKLRSGNISLSVTVLFVVVAQYCFRSFAQILNSLTSVIALFPLYRGLIGFIEQFYDGDKSATGSVSSEAVDSEILNAKQKLYEHASGKNGLIVLTRMPFLLSTSAHVMKVFTEVEDQFLESFVRASGYFSILQTPTEATMTEALSISQSDIGKNCFDLFGFESLMLDGQLADIWKLDLTAPLNKNEWNKLPEAVRVIFKAREFFKQDMDFIFVDTPWFSALPGEGKTWFSSQKKDSFYIYLYNTRPHYFTQNDDMKAYYLDADGAEFCCIVENFSTHRSAISDFFTAAHADQYHEIE